MRGVSKAFGRVVALDGADLTGYPGEVHGVVGENGAGKTTLMNVLAGMVRPQDGEVFVEGVPVEFSKPRDAWRRGIGMVHQHFTLVPRLSVLENVALGVRSGGHGFRLPYPRIRRRLDELRKLTGFAVADEVRVEDLSAGERQRVEILKLLVRDPEVLIFDEPTAVLAPQEVKELIGVFRRLAADGRTVLLIAHKLDEVLEAADRITVLRNGATVHQCLRADADAGVLTRAMVGRDVHRGVKASVPAGPTIAKLMRVGATGPHGQAAVAEVDLEVRRGEIVGIAGVDGNGQGELSEILAAVRQPDSGTVELPGRIGFIPADRVGEGLIGSFDLSENLGLALMNDSAFRQGPLIRWSDVRVRTTEAVDRYGIQASGIQTRTAHLSGGNQQKLVVARELERGRDLLVARNPTRGLDVSAAEFVRGELLRLCSQRGPSSEVDDRPGIVLISTDLDEILELADRIHVIVRGRLLSVEQSDVSRETIGRLMLAGVEAPDGG
jgi:simple sugar transport system ATP-binding protein